MTDSQSRLDLSRQQRLGMVEAVWGEHKTPEQIIEILGKLEGARELALVTRVEAKKARQVISVVSKAQYHKQSRCLTLGAPAELQPSLGKVVVLSGGTSDLVVASEALLALHWHGIHSELLLDVGVSGLHRLLGRLEELKNAKALIACAGMEGALPTVLAGLVPQPVIGVPVAVGYGVSASGKTALEGMLASCAPGLAVMNIDNGYGAAMAALRILKA